MKKLDYKWQNIHLKIHRHELTTERKEDIISVYNRKMVKIVKLLRKYFSHGSNKYKKLVEVKDGRSYENMPEIRSQENTLSSFNENSDDENPDDYLTRAFCPVEATIGQHRLSTQEGGTYQFAEGRRRAFTEVQENIIVDGSDEDSFHSRNVRRRRAFSDMELRSEIREMKNNLLKQTLEDCNML